MVDETTGGNPLTWADVSMVMAGNDIAASPSVCKQVPLDDLAELLSAADECAEDLATALDHEYADRDTYPSYYRKYERDMAPVRRLRAAVARVRRE